MNQPVDVKDGSTTTAAAAATHALLTPPQRQVLLALADALFPVPDAHDGDDTTAVDLDDPVFSTSVHTHPETVAFMEQQLVALVPPAMLPSILLLFTALSTTAGTVMLALPGALWEGRVPSMRAFPQLTATERRRVLLAWSKSWVPQLRALPRALYNLTAMAMLGKTVGGTRTNPFWKAMDYDAPTTAPVCTDVDGDKDDDKNDVDDDDDTEDVDDDDDKNDVNVNDNDTPSPHYDAIIIGSGIGGGVMADALAAAGFNVLVCEKGKRFRRKELSMYEEDAYARMFENGGLVGSEDGAVNFLAGATFGGGSAINWSASLQTPAYVRKEWAERFGLTHFITPAFQASLDRISARIGVSTTAITHNTPNQLLLDGCRKLGYPASAIPQNTAGKAHACGWCHLGCPTGVKQGVHVTYLKEAAQNGAKMVCECEVDRIVRDERGNVVGVDVTIGNGGSEGADKGSSRKMRITSSIVVVSAGSLNTPAILLRSGFQNKHIGQHLHVHPVVIAMGVFPGTRTRMSHGSIMTTISSIGEMGPTGDGYGTRLEVPTSHPILGGAILPFIAPFVKERVYAKQNRMIAYKFAEMACLIVLHRDRDSEGSVTLDAQGRRIIRYTLRDHDSQALTTGLTHAFDVLLSAGATELFSSSSAAPPFQLGERRDDDKQGEHALHGTIADPAYRAHITTIKRTRVRAPLNTPLASAHQMSTCRMASTPHLGACRPTGQLWESDDVWVCDASLFPTASGVNPMLTNYAISDGVARACVEYLGKKLGRVEERRGATVQE